MDKILIVEDDAEIAMLERDYLEISGFETKTLTSGKDASEEAVNGGYSLILLDLMLPDKSGCDICREIRDEIDIPILMVTAKTESVDKIRGLVMGADDYISKPFDPMELVARVRAHINQYKRLTGKERHYITVRDIKIETACRAVYKNDAEIQLSSHEYDLLLFLVQNPNVIFTKEQLFEKIWGFDYAGDSAAVMVHINRIREKLEDDPKNPQIIETIWGAGYR
ncbi:MAG: response regulator transcription factor, partial [Firmicutes bacterium]|nr:response regulator transcription factor [Bacillota bacterium]